MSKPVEESYTRLEERAAALESLVDEQTDKRIVATLQTAFAGLKGAAALLLELEDQSFSVIDQKLAAARKSPSLLRQIDAMFSMKTVTENYPKLLESGELLSKGKDVEAIRNFATEVLKTAAGIGASISGIKYAKDVAEFVGTVESLAKTGQALKYRRKQVQDASSLLRWAQAVSIASIAWSYSVQNYLLDINGKTRATQSDVLQLVTDRVAKNSRKWKP